MVIKKKDITRPLERQLKTCPPEWIPLVSKMLGLIARSCISFNLASLIIEKWLQED